MKFVIRRNSGWYAEVRYTMGFECSPEFKKLKQLMKWLAMSYPGDFGWEVSDD